MLTTHIGAIEVYAQEQQGMMNAADALIDKVFSPNTFLISESLELVTPSKIAHCQVFLTKF